MSSSTYTYHPFHTIGPATVLLWDGSAGSGGAWQHFGRAADCAVFCATESAAKSAVVKGLRQPVAQRPRSQRYSLSLRLLEAAGPAALELLYSGGAAPTAGAEAAVASSEVLRLYAGDYSELAHPYGILPLPALTLKSYDAATTYVADTDYQFEREQGRLRRLPGGAIADGQRVVAAYSYTRPTSVSVPLGGSAAAERYRQVKLLQLAPADPGLSPTPPSELDPATWRETGVEFTFYRVHVQPPETTWPFVEDDFSDGVALSWDCLYDSASGKVGEVRSTYGVLAAYE